MSADFFKADKYQSGELDAQPRIQPEHQPSLIEKEWLDECWRAFLKGRPSPVPEEAARIKS